MRFLILNIRDISCISSTAHVGYDPFIPRRLTLIPLIFRENISVFLLYFVESC